MHTQDITLPSNIEAENVLLGSVLIDNDKIAEVCERLADSDFYSPVNRMIFQAMVDLYAKSEPIEPVSIAEIGKSRNNEIQVSRVLGLMSGVPPFVKLDKYIDIVESKSRARRFIKACSNGVMTASTETDDIMDLIDRTENEIYSLRDYNKGRMQSLGELVVESVEHVSERARNPEMKLGVKTGFKDIDFLTGGFQNTDLIILAARPSMGKSALSLDLCAGVTKEDPQAVVAYFSLEMSKRQCAERLICAIAEIDSSRYRIGMLSPNDWEEVERVSNMLIHKRINIDDTPALSVLDIKSKSRHILSREGRLDMIVIDYLQLMRGSRKTDSRQQEVSDISRDLKALAKDLGVPIVALSQLSRSCESRQDKRPLLSDLRESGAIEQDADIVAFLYRDEYYNEPTEQTAGMAELIFRKHRHGATDTVPLRFVKRFAKFLDGRYANQL
jgi:replicative DNA helicase